jgi:predicted CoA-substrate-specific enzyme activase
MKGLGICVGASTISLVGIGRDAEGRIHKKEILTEPHSGNPKKVLFEILEKLDLRDYSRMAVTGRQFREGINLTSIPEPEAVERALFHLNGRGENYNAVVSAGGETFMVYVLGRDGRISTVHTGNKCASGTGEFFLQQIARLGLGTDEAIRLARCEKPYRVSGRCSVFCKSDCTHATNKGIPKGRVVAGLCQMIAGKILEIMKQVPRENIMVVGGTSQNEVVMDYLRQEIPNLWVPEEAPYFEALGAALWALDHETKPYPGRRRLFRGGNGSFTLHPPIEDFSTMVDFRNSLRGSAREGDRCILGLDVGSTTTKAVILRLDDQRILASVYLRTNGDPVGASRRCYAGLFETLGAVADRIEIVGLGVTGSGRQVAGLHALTEGIVNEIAAHATAALFFDPGVDTIFEIGGQDAKYTHLTNGVPSDYAMNEACSAGTGSFLEEAARESLGVDMEAIAGIALQGRNPPNFNDQCAAFISSDIKRATHEGTSREDIVAGLVYSVCMNYHKRVKGSRPVGSRIFMQGGVCYNRAVPMAMAALIGKKIVVPPDPGLMGAFGVALEIKKRLDLGLMGQRRYRLRELLGRELEYDEPFVCQGGREKCDRRCEIARVRIGDRIYPFGGACNRWYNLRFKRDFDWEKLDLVAFYERKVFETAAEHSDDPAGEKTRTVGLNRSFFTHTHFPLYAAFFRRLGFRVVLPASIEQSGVDRRGAAFCYPAEISHGYLENLLKEDPDYLFLPHFMGNPRAEGSVQSITCPISQAEPYYLASAFKDHPVYRRLREKGGILNPVVSFMNGYDEAEKTFAEIAFQMGATRKAGVRAYRAAVSTQKNAQAEMREAAKAALREIESCPEAIGIVIFGRSYNAFVSEAHMGIPKKIASRGIPVIPVDLLPLEDEPVDGHMYWSAGQTILRGASFVKRHPQLFGCYITNFSCGPDSFLIGFFRDIMKEKPSLTLELDSHVADAGLETRIEAFVDIVRSFRVHEKKKTIFHLPFHSEAPPCRFDPLRQVFIDETGECYPLQHPGVHVVLPSMGRYTAEIVAAAFRGFGIRITALPPPDHEVLELGKDHTLCKECLPLQLTVGSLIKYIRTKRDEEELLAYFMPTASGPCRFGQYSTFVENMIRKVGIRRAAVFSLSGENSYGEVEGESVVARMWSCIVIADIMEEIYSVLLTCAAHPVSAREVFWSEWDRIKGAVEKGVHFRKLTALIRTVADRLGEIPLLMNPAETPTILITGEIYVRHDDLSRQYLVEKLAEKGFIVRVSSNIEWLYYADWCYRKGLTPFRIGPCERLSLMIRNAVMRKKERVIRKIMTRSGLVEDRLEDLNRTIDCGRAFIHPRLAGETILTLGAAITEILDHCCGVIALGPFGCMPNRIAEAILSSEMRSKVKKRVAGSPWWMETLLDRIEVLPFLAIESDGNPFPQIIMAKLETFLLQAARVHREIMALREPADEGTPRLHPDGTMLLINEKPSIIFSASV